MRGSRRKVAVWRWGAPLPVSAARDRGSMCSNCRSVRLCSPALVWACCADENGRSETLIVCDGCLSAGWEPQCTSVSVTASAPREAGCLFEVLHSSPCFALLKAAAKVTAELSQRPLSDACKFASRLPANGWAGFRLGCHVQVLCKLKVHRHEHGLKIDNMACQLTSNLTCSSRCWGAAKRSTRMTAPF